MTIKFQWGPQVPDLIWWQVHGSTIQLFSHPDRRRIRKFIFKWLPTCEQLSKYNRELDDSCLSCGALETHAHLFCCPCTTRQQIRATWLTQFKKFLSNTRYTPEVIRHLFYNQIHHMCTHELHPQIDLGLYHADIQQAGHQQKQIGWDQLLSGRLAIGWSTVIANYLHHNKIPESEMSAANWCKLVTQQMFGLVIKTWLQRNEEAHARNSSNESLLTRQRLLAQILQLQESEPDIRYCDRDFVHKSPEVLAEYTLPNLRAWHRAALSIIRSNTRRNRNNRSQPLITQHFVSRTQRRRSSVDSGNSLPSSNGSQQQQLPTNTLSQSGIAQHNHVLVHSRSSTSTGRQLNEPTHPSSSSSRSTNSIDTREFLRIHDQRARSNMQEQLGTSTNSNHSRPVISNSTQSLIE